jgi:carbonic anhydrase
LLARLRVCRPAGDGLEALLAGNRRFAELWQSTSGERSPDLAPAERMQRFAALWSGNCQPDPAALAQGQRPWAAVLTCADSRVAPEWLFDQGPGELFDVRSAGNTAFNAGIASLEYAVAELAVPLIVVLGHSGCGAVTAALASDPLTPLLEELVLPIRASLAGADRSPGTRPGTRPDLAQAVQRHARAAAASLTSRSALLAAAQQRGALQITPAYFDLATGLVRVL